MHYVNNKKIGLIFSWISLTLLFLYLLYVIAPGKGAHWSSDDGHVLLNAWNLSENRVFSTDFPQQPMYLVHAILMKIGMQEYLHFRYLFYFVTLIGSILFYSGLDKNGFSSPFVPIASMATLTVSFTSISYFYQFFLIGMGLYFCSKRIRGPLITPILLTLSAFFIGLQGLSAGIAIGMIVLVILMISLDNSLRRSIFPVIFFITIVGLWVTYTYLLGLTNLLTVPPGHTADAGYFIQRIKQIMTNNLFVMFFCLIIYFGFKSIAKIRSIYLYLLISTLISLLFVAEFIAATSSDDIFLELRTFAFSYIPEQYINKFGIRNLVIMQVPMFSYYLLLNSFFYFLYISSWRTGGKTNIKSALSVLRSGDNLLLIFGVIGYLLLFSSYTVGSNVFFHTLLSAFSGVFLGISVIFIGKFTNWNAHLWTSVFGCLLVALWLCVFVILGVKFNIPSLQPIYNLDKNIISSGRLKGLRETNAGINALNEVSNTYEKYGCANKILITFDYIPLLVYSLENKYSPNLQFVRLTHGFPVSKIDKLLKENTAWCVIDTSTKETLDFISASNNQDARNETRQKVVNSMLHSKKIIGPSEDIPSITIYSR